MHKKSELEAMSQEELIDIAKNLGIPSPNEGDRMGLIYQIIDEESILSASQKATTTKTPRKRVRVSKKETDRVYSASQGNGENFDMKKKEAARDNKEEATELKNEKTTPVISPELADLPVEAIVEKEISDNTIENNAEAIAAPAPKKRGRKSKAEKAALEAAAKLAEEQATVLSDEAKQLPVMDEPITDVPLEILQDIPAQPTMRQKPRFRKSRKKRNLWHLLQKISSLQTKMISSWWKTSPSSRQNRPWMKRI